jgi:prepilin-type processing-associated H-X9-DG protein/prepilin-type N-terminal cleavage/methylation domain-containing protein
MAGLHMGVQRMNSKKAFTLIELLVVIAIIAMLMGVLMPALAKARNLGKTVICLSNLRQMFIASQTYAANNNDYYCMAYVNDPDPMDSIAIYTSWDFTNIKDWNTMQEEIKPGLIWQGETIEEIHQCPSFKGESNSLESFSGYNYNTSYIGHGSSEKITVPARTVNVKNPSSNALFGDGQYYDGANKFMRSPWTHDGDGFSFRSTGTQGYRHSNKTNVAWCDGHVSSQKELYTDTFDKEKEKIENYNLANPNDTVGFLSPDNSVYDLK